MAPESVEFRRAETVVFQLPFGYGRIGKECRVPHWVPVDRGTRGDKLTDAPVKWPAERGRRRRTPERQPGSPGPQNHYAEAIGQVSFLCE